MLLFFFDKIAFPFYILHNSVGWNILQFLVYCLNMNIYFALVLTIILDIGIIALYYYIIEKYLDKLLNKVYNALTIREKISSQKKEN